MTQPTGEPTTFNLLFVCTGNTCRSPMAEALARARLRERGWSHVAVRSAGVAASGGAAASPHAVTVAGEAGLDLAGHQSRALGPEDVGWADLILVMGPHHLAAVDRLGGGEKASLITAVEGDGGVPVDDPFGGDVAGYRRTFAQLDQAVRHLLERLEPILSP